MFSWVSKTETTEVAQEKGLLSFEGAPGEEETLIVLSSSAAPEASPQAETMEKIFPCLDLASWH